MLMFNRRNGSDLMLSDKGFELGIDGQRKVPLYHSWQTSTIPGGLLESRCCVSLSSWVIPYRPSFIQHTESSRQFPRFQRPGLLYPASDSLRLLTLNTDILSHTESSSQTSRSSNILKHKSKYQNTNRRRELMVLLLLWCCEIRSSSTFILNLQLKKPTQLSRWLRRARDVMIIRCLSRG